MIFLTLNQCFNYISAGIFDVAVNHTLFSIKVKVHEINMENFENICNGIA